jgi:hypothetical protein
MTGQDRDLSVTAEGLREAKALKHMTVADLRRCDIDRLFITHKKRGWRSFDAVHQRGKNPRTTGPFSGPVQPLRANEHRP